jgi:hypothetical protein
MSTLCDCGNSSLRCLSVLFPAGEWFGSTSLLSPITGSGQPPLTHATLSAAFNGGLFLQPSLSRSASTSAAFFGGDSPTVTSANSSFYQFQGVGRSRANSHEPRDCVCPISSPNVNADSMPRPSQTRPSTAGTGLSRGMSPGARPASSASARTVGTQRPSSSGSSRRPGSSSTCRHSARTEGTERESQVRLAHHATLRTLA